MIEIRDIKKSFDDKTVINGISYTFEEGKTNLIIGASGTGKSVLLKCMVGLVQPDSGVVYYHGRDFTNGDKNTKRDIRREIGMLFQGGALFDSKTVEENVMFPLDVLTKTPRDEKLDRVNFCLKKVGLENTNKKMPSELSGGMKKRVGIARAIVNTEVRYLYCDEPNSGLDPQTSIKIDNLIKEITDEFKVTTIVVTHDMNSVMEIGQNIIFLYQGEKLWEGTKENIAKSEVKQLHDFIFASQFMKKLKKHAREM
jgi:phospholipid/cholesterol/gamma-HCH transport system ATP-binding protein